MDMKMDASLALAGLQYFISASVWKGPDFFATQEPDTKNRDSHLFMSPPTHNCDFLLCSFPNCWLCEAAGRTQSAASQHKQSLVGPSHYSWSAPQSNVWGWRCWCRTQTLNHTEIHTVLLISIGHPKRRIIQ